MRPMKKTVLVISIASVLLALLTACASDGNDDQPSVAYYGGSDFAYGAPVFAYSAYGAPAAWDYSSGYAHGAYGGSAAWSDGSGFAHGAFGGSAAWDHGSGFAYGPHGGSAAWSDGSGFAHGAGGRSFSWHR